MLQDRVQMILCTSCAKTATQRKIRSVNCSRMISRRALLVSILKVKGGGRRWGGGKQEVAAAITIRKHAMSSFGVSGSTAAPTISRTIVSVWSKPKYTKRIEIELDHTDVVKV